MLISAAAEVFAKAKTLVQSQVVKKKQYLLAAKQSKPAHIKVRKVFSEPQYTQY